MDGKMISSVENLIHEVKKDYREWDTSTFPWFRGEPEDITSPLLPNLYREEHNENQLLQHFRMKAPMLGLMDTPPRNHTDQWLFLAQHVGIPTRLLDWTEGLLIALHFALHSRKDGAIVWMLDPTELNRQSDPFIKDNDFPLSWFTPEKAPAGRGELAEYFNLLSDRSLVKAEKFKSIRAHMIPNIGNRNIRGAWENDSVGTTLPVAIHPTHIHPRISTQKSCFTIHGKNKAGIIDLVDSRILRKYIIEETAIENIKIDMQLLGITHSSLYPDLDGLARDLKEVF
jgi:hypothetical protein